MRHWYRSIVEKSGFTNDFWEFSGGACPPEPQSGPLPFRNSRSVSQSNLYFDMQNAHFFPLIYDHCRYRHQCLLPIFFQQISSVSGPPETALIAIRHYGLTAGRRKNTAHDMVKYYDYWSNYTWLKNLGDFIQLTACSHFSGPNSSSVSRKKIQK